MTLQRLAGICGVIVITSAAAAGQQQSGRAIQPSSRVGPSLLERSHWNGYVAPKSRVFTRTQSNGRNVVVETTEGLNIDGRPAAIEEVVTETTAGVGTTNTRREVFRFTMEGHRRLAETIESRQDIRPNGDAAATRDTRVLDVNGRPRLVSRVVEETRASAAGVRRTDTTLLLPGINERLRETERIELTTQRINPEVVRRESTLLRRDINGGWKPVEIRRGEVREQGASNFVEEETLHRRDLNGNLSVADVTVIRGSRGKDQEQVVIETFSSQIDVPRMNGRPPLSERVSRTTTVAADGVRYTVEDVEARSRVSASAPMRLIRRTVTTVTPAGNDQWVTRREVFEPDLDGRMRLVRFE